jgi:hypothetical protein
MLETRKCREEVETPEAQLVPDPDRETLRRHGIGGGGGGVQRTGESPAHRFPW